MKKTNSNMSRLAVTAALVAALGLTACGSDDSGDASADTTAATADTAATEATDAGVSIADPWSRQPAEGQTASAVYGVVTNNTDETITAIAATSPVSDDVQLHEVVMNDENQMTMQEKEGGYEIPAGESLTFEPGGAHIMLLDIDPATYPDTVDVTLMFDNDTTLDFTAEVRALDDEAMDDMEGTEDMDHSEMDESEMTDDTMDHSDTDDSEMDEMEEAPTTEG